MVSKKVSKVRQLAQTDLFIVSASARFWVRFDKFYQRTVFFGMLDSRGVPGLFFRQAFASIVFAIGAVLYLPFFLAKQTAPLWNFIFFVLFNLSKMLIGAIFYITSKVFRLLGRCGVSSR